MPSEKVSVIPLAYESSREALTFRRTYPKAFTKDRPFKVLFLCQVNLRKGIRELIAAAQILDGEPIEFWLVGPVQFHLPPALCARDSIKLLGAVPRSKRQITTRRRTYLCFQATLTALV